MRSVQTVDQLVEVLEAVMTEDFTESQGNRLSVPDRICFDPYPWKSFASWISTQLERWGYMPTESAHYNAIGEQIFLTDLARELAAELGVEAPAKLSRIETLKFGYFDSTQADEYLKPQRDQFGA